VVDAGCERERLRVSKGVREREEGGARERKRGSGDAQRKYSWSSFVLLMH